jgi:hypothetical protein
LRFLTNFESRCIEFDDIRKTFWSIVVNCFKISNLLSEVCFDDAKLTSIFFGVKNVPKFQHFAALARIPEQM